MKINPFGINEITMVSMATYRGIQKNGGLCSNEQFGTHEKLSPTRTIYVNCIKHDPTDLIYNFTLSKALLIHMYIVSIWCMTSFTTHLASYMCLYIILDLYSQVT